ncbi:EF-hand domain-containing family member C2 [Caerostris darwini]|uniref:EF-hand domain-containing family member C2 n=1 Tax=Caerostris darwini TaxID=1538125 RepID=A0AAV4W7L5_9ARAC|nr:EF-hand domain-containing family member C2 [Caerostris darwini]
MTLKTLDEDLRNKTSMAHSNLRRMKATMPHSTGWNEGRCFYEPTDFYVGNVIYVRNTPYLLLEADEYTYDYLEQHCEKFPHSNIKKITGEFTEWVPDKCEELKNGFEKYDPEKTGYINFDQFMEVLYEEMPNEIKLQYPEHAVRTVGRWYAEEKYTGLCFHEMRRKVQTELFRKKFYDFEDLKLALQIHDKEKSGYLDPDRVYYVMRTTKSLEINRDVLKSFLYK